MAQSPPTHGTLLELCVRQAGGDVHALGRGARVCEFILAWAQATRDEGKPITMSGFCRYWGAGFPRRTAWRRLGEFRAVFPDEGTPQRFSEVLLAAHEGQLGPLTPVWAA
jgi:hypothetical protein